MVQDKWLKYSVFSAMLLALVVVTLGAYTRLTDAGLGCPDWPGCYGHMVLPHKASALQVAQANFPDVPVEQVKAWTEMVHRYVAGSLAFLLLLIAIRALYLRIRDRFAYWRMPAIIVCLVILQAALGMWTVTMKLLPVVVMSHLLGGMTIFSLLCYYNVKITNPSDTQLTRQLYWVLGGIFVVFCQIALGGWVSANYAGIACVGFPKCNGLWLPSLHLGQGFNLFTSIGENYQGGLLDSEIRVTIQMIHRIGAMVTAIYLFGLSIFIYRTSHNELQRFCAIFIGLLLVMQICLGIANVMYRLPLPVAVAHNGVAAMLLASLMAMLAIVMQRRTDDR
ncbi:heme A synthase [Legionella sp. W05-934-2]|uniref:COX15/CtaA family protein n=1 Tax=Legionella sp. W05-934-2 TaxID=1198649 RepID=UPI00346335C2